MSPKLTSKNLSYDASLPPFLQRLRAQNIASPAPLPRPKRTQNPNDAEEDEPVYVDADGATLDAAELRGLGVMKGEPEKDEQPTQESNTEGETELWEKGKKAREKAAIGTARKRRVGRVVGADEGKESKESGSVVVTSKKNTQAASKKKAKKVKLSFSDDE